ncbi:MAG: AAA family ATPase, partial [Patescibacteria group bacterium]
MILTSIKLSHFRNFNNREFVFNKSLTIIYGQNARGKTNILESIYFISNGSGFRESKESELLSFDIKIGLGSVEGMYKSTTGSFRNKITLRRQGESVEKIFFVNNTKRRSSQYIEDQIKTVLFSPEQMELITGSPDKRRVYFNRCISFYDPEYKKRVDNYDTALRKRNKVLEMHKDRSAVLKELEYWNDYLIEQANYITKIRQEYILFLNNNPSLDHKSFT